jgi:tetratricopeptide (TPR) repeat protein
MENNGLITIVLFFLTFVIVQPSQVISQISINQSRGVDNITLLYNKSQIYDKAMKYYDKALSLDPNNTDVLTNKGILLIKLAKYNEALKLFDNILHINPSNVGALYNKAVALDKLGRHNEAVTLYAIAHRIDPNYKGDFINRISESPSIATPKSESLK